MGPQALSASCRLPGSWGTAPQRRASGQAARRRPGGAAPLRRARLVAAAATPGGSIDDDEGLDYGLTRELDQVNQRYVKLASHLELLYQASGPQAGVRPGQGRRWGGRWSWVGDRAGRGAAAAPRAQAPAACRCSTAPSD